MIVIDVDSLNTPTKKKMVLSIVSSKLKKVFDKEGNAGVKASTPIYWLSKSRLNMEDIKALGLIPIGTVLHVASIIEGLREMVKTIDNVAEGLKMGRVGKFRQPVDVVTDKDYLEIEALGARVIPTELFMIAGGRA